MSLPQELQIRIIKEATLLELLEYFDKFNKQKLMFSLLINSHCCCCGKVLPIFYSKYYALKRQYFHYPSGLSDVSDNGNLYYQGKFCSKYCWKRLIEYQYDEGGFPPYHQVRSGFDGDGFFEMLNRKYSNVWNKTDIGLRFN